MMQPVETVGEQIARLGAPSEWLLVKKAAARIFAELLEEDERLTWLGTARGWLAVCTNRRVLCARKKLFGGLQHLEIPLDQIVRTEQSKSGLTNVKVVFVLKESTTSLELPKKSVSPFLNALRADHDAPPEQSSLSPADSTNAAPLSTSEIVTEIEKLATLHREGVLTSAEFESQKAKLLGR